MLCKLINIFVGGILLCKDFFLKTVGKLLGRVDVFVLILGEWAYFFFVERAIFLLLKLKQELFENERHLDTDGQHCLQTA